MELMTGRDVDKRLLWPLGRAEKMARNGKIPHILLPDGGIRFDRNEIESLIKPTSRLHSEDSGGQDV